MLGFSPAPEKGLPALEKTESPEEDGKDLQIRRDQVYRIPAATAAIKATSVSRGLQFQSAEAEAPATSSRAARRTTPQQIVSDLRAFFFVSTGSKVCSQRESDQIGSSQGAAIVPK